MIGDLTDDPIEIAMKDLSAARGRIKKDKFRLLALDSTDSAFDLRSAALSGLQVCHHGLNGDDGPSNARQNFSLSSLPLWAKRLVATQGADCWEKVFPPGKRLFAGLTSVCQYIEYYGTGGGLVRPLMADFLEEAGASLGNQELAALGVTYREIGEQWSKLADMALPDRVALFSECQQLFDQYAELCNSHGSLDEKRQYWSRLQEIERSAAIEFPLSPSESTDLKAAMADCVLAIHQQETAAQRRLLEVL